jgi:adenylosuccinate lyase
MSVAWPVPWAAAQPRPASGLIVSEAVMLELGDVLGRQTAHDVVYDAAQEAMSGAETFATILGDDQRVAAHLGSDAIDALLDPAQYLGLCSSIAVAAASEARAAASGLPELAEDGGTVPPAAG